MIGRRTSVRPTTPTGTIMGPMRPRWSASNCPDIWMSKLRSSSRRNNDNVYGSGAPVMAIAAGFEAGVPRPLSKSEHRLGHGHRTCRVPPGLVSGASPHRQFFAGFCDAARTCALGYDAAGFAWIIPTRVVGREWPRAVAGNAVRRGDWAAGGNYDPLFP